MPRPNAESSVDVLSSCIKSVPAWFIRYTTILGEELDEHFNGVEKANALAKFLEDAQALVETERKEDKGITLRRDNLIHILRRFQKSTSASVQLRLQEHPDRDKILRDFNFDAPSRIRSVTQGLKRLREMETSIKVHRDDLRKGGKDRSEFWLKRIETLRKDFEAFSLDDVRERKETRIAYEKRDEAQEKVAAFLKTVELVAEALMDIDEAPFNELQIIFDRWNPPAPSRRATKTSDSPEEPSDTSTS